MKEFEEFKTFTKVVEHCNKTVNCLDCKYLEVCNAYYDDEYLPKKAKGWWIKDK